MATDPVDEPGPARPAIKVEDRRHWARSMADEENADRPEPDVEDAQDARAEAEDYRTRAEAAERRLEETVAAYRAMQAETEALRGRLTRDAERQLELRFAALVRELLSTVDDLELALSHVRAVREAEPLADGVRLAVQKFLATLERVGVARLEPDGRPFDPATAEAVRVDSVEDPDRDGTVTETLRPGYALGEQLIRPASVAVGRRSGS
jgi:molecular chaperone GrpE